MQLHICILIPAAASRPLCGPPPPARCPCSRWLSRSAPCWQPLVSSRLTPRAHLFGGWEREEGVVGATGNLRKRKPSMCPSLSHPRSQLAPLSQSPPLSLSPPQWA